MNFGNRIFRSNRHALKGRLRNLVRFRRRLSTRRQLQRRRTGLPNCTYVFKQKITILVDFGRPWNEK
jgi:hypothetical protein